MTLGPRVSGFGGRKSLSGVQGWSPGGVSVSLCLLGPIWGGYTDVPPRLYDPAVHDAQFIIAAVTFTADVGDSMTAAVLFRLCINSRRLNIVVVSTERCSAAHRPRVCNNILFIQHEYDSFSYCDGK